MKKRTAGVPDPIELGVRCPIVIERFFEKFTATKGCWLWTGRRCGKWGYGKFHVSGDARKIVGRNYRSTGAHRFSYVLFKGAIPEGLTIDHLCRNTRCVNPDHLEAVTHAENARRVVQKRKAV